VTPPLTWVVGRGGLLGGAVERALSTTSAVGAPALQVPWGTPDAAGALAGAARRFAAEAGTGPWQLAWCAGAGVTTSSRGQLATEVNLLRLTLEALATEVRGPGAVFVASSAGGAYAGVRQRPPFTEQTPPVPLSAYGEAKLDAERLAIEWGRRTGVPVVVGRIANLYGPGQSLPKHQGLISRFCCAYLTKQPLLLYMPLDTVRDYLYVDDAGALVAQMLRAARDLPPGASVVKIMASHRALTIGALLGEMRRLLRRPPPVVYGSSPAALLQARDLRLRSVTWPKLDRRSATPLPVGISATMEDLRASLRSGSLAGAARSPVRLPAQALR
jgi:UDP-glucose 4-epimerase